MNFKILKRAIIINKLLLVQIKQMSKAQKPTTVNFKVDEKGNMLRPDSTFRDFISSKPGAKYPPEMDRYHVYVNLACPWLLQFLARSTWKVSRKCSLFPTLSHNGAQLTPRAEAAGSSTSLPRPTDLRALTISLAKKVSTTSIDKCSLASMIKQLSQYCSTKKRKQLWTTRVSK